MNNNNTYNFAASLFRLYLSFHILKKYVLYFFEKETLFGNHSFISHHEDFLFQIFNVNTIIIRNNIGLLMTFTLILAIFYAFGIGRNYTCILLLISIEVLQRLNGLILNGGDNLLKFILLYMCFVNSYEYFVYKKSDKDYNGNIKGFLSRMGVFSVKVHLCMIYLISALHKVHSDVWFNGIANYYILSINRFSNLNGSEIDFYKNYIIVTLTTYITLFWELSFSYLVWIKKFRLPMLLIGVLLHCSIYYYMMIHDFEILFIATYILFFKDYEFLSLKKYLKPKLAYVRTRYFSKNYRTVL
jgi:hypothetical protein